MKNENGTMTLSAVILSISFCFTLFFFAPADIYLDNQTDFVISGIHILATLLAAAAAGGFIMTSILLLIKKLNKKVFEAVSALLTGLLAAFYFQLLFLNGKMQSITGDEIKYAGYNASNMINLGVYTLIVLIPLVILALQEQKPQNITLKNIKKNGVLFFSAMVFVMQLTGTLSLAAKNGITKKDIGAKLSYFSYEPLMSMSKDENIVVFLTDRLDGRWMDEMLEKYPELYDSFEGFTFYRDNVSCNCSTYPSILEMLSGKVFEVGEENFHKRAWEKGNIPDVLKSSGWKVNLLLSCLSGYSKEEYITNYCDNYIESTYKTNINYFGSNGVLETMTDFSLAKLTPYVMKPMFISDYQSDFSNNFVTIPVKLIDKKQDAVGIGSDLDFYNFIKATDIKADSDKKTFSFVHLNCSHDVSDDLAHLYDESLNNADVYDTTRGDFVILECFFEKMKAAGVYDNTTIIVVGDHGRPPVYADNIDEIYHDEILTTLLIKPVNAEHKILQTESESEMSNKFFSASILDFAGLPHDDYGLSYNDIIRDDIKTDRYLNNYDFRDPRNPLLARYRIRGDAHDVKNWEIVDGKAAVP